MLSIVAYILLAIGGLILAAGGIWFLVVAFKESPLWGVIVFIFPLIGTLIFLIKFWSDAWKPFAAQALGLVITVVGAVLFIPAMANDLTASTVEAFEDSYSEDAYGDEYDDYDEYSDDEYGDEYSEDDAYGDDSYRDDADAGDDTAVAAGDADTEDVSGDGDGTAPADSQVADASSADAPPAAALPTPTAASTPRRPSTPPARLGGSFARSSDESSIPMELASDYIGKRVKIVKTNGNVVYCRLLDVTEDSLMIHQSIGGGMVRFTLPKDTIQRLAKDTRR